MKQKGLERLTMILLFVLVLIVFSLAQRDTRKLDRLYKTATLLQKAGQLHTVHLPAAPAKAANN